MDHSTRNSRSSGQNSCANKNRNSFTDLKIVSKLSGVFDGQEGEKVTSQIMTIFGII